MAKVKPPDLAVRGVAWNRVLNPAYAPSREIMIAMAAGMAGDAEGVMARSERGLNLAPGCWMHKSTPQKPTVYSPFRMRATAGPSASFRSTLTTFTSGWVSGT